MSSEAPAPRALDLAQEAYELVQVDPRRAAAAAARARAAAVLAADPEAEVLALHALSWAQRVLGDPNARATLSAGLRIAERNGDRRGIARLRRSLAASHAFAGELRSAKRELERALAAAGGRDYAEAQVIRLAIHRRTQSGDQASEQAVLDGAARALRLFRRQRDELWQARLLFNRGILLSDRGEFGRATTDLQDAHDLYARQGAADAASDAVIEIAALTLMQGRVVDCLSLLDEIEPTLTPGEFHNSFISCRARALREARLIREARAATEAYAELCARTGHDDWAVVVLSDLASLTLIAGEPDAARELALRAARSLAARGKPVDAALARMVATRAALESGTVDRSSLRSAVATAALLERAGWSLDALRVRVLAARVALSLAATAVARRELELSRCLRRRGSVADRMELAHAEALLSRASDEPERAERQLKAGLRLLDDYRAAFGAAELRATASGIGVELSELGLRIALESGSPAKALVWAERLRGTSLRLPPIRPPADAGLAALQTELRRVSRDESNRRRPALEAAIRSRSRLVKGSPAGSSTVRIRDVSVALGERALIEYIELDGRLTALTVAGGRITRHDLGVDTSRAEVEWLRFALARLARLGREPTAREHAREAVQASAANLDRMLVAPVLPAVGCRPLVLVPTGGLHAVPWAALPSLAGSPVVVSPSLTLWMDLAGRSRSRRRKTALIAGARLRQAGAEIRDLAGLHPGATVLTGAAATVEATLAALDGAAVAHLACHGNFRSDSPLFSSLELIDGALNVHQLEQLERPPEIVILSACDLAVSALHPGDELLGLSAALLGMGTRTVVASVVPVPDGAARRLMHAFHRLLAGRQTPAAALAQAQSGREVAGFVCLGSG